MQPNSSQRSRDSRTRIPPQVERQMAQQMKKSMPASMQRYIGPYMQQHVTGPTTTNAARPNFSPQMRTMQPNIGNPTLPHSSRPQSLEFKPTHEAQPTISEQPVPMDPQNPSTTPPPEPYDFILNPPPPPKKPLLPGGSNKIVKVGFILGGLLILFILLSFIKGIVTSNPSVATLTVVAQDQQAILQITKQAKEVTGLNETNKNFVATANPALTTSQSEIIAYLAKNGKKINAKELVLKTDPQTTKELTSANEANNYNETFKAVMTRMLAAYSKDLEAAYPTVKGPKGKTLLNNSYTQAQLLLVQISGQTSTENTSP